MFAGSLILGITLCCFAAWLQQQEKNGWPEETFVTELDRQYRDRRTRSRGRIHCIIFACGVLIMVAAFAEPGALWLAAWSLVIIGLLIIVFLAAIDGFRTHRYHVEKLPELRQEILGDEESR